MRTLAKFFEHWKLYLIPLVLFPIIGTLYGQHTLSVYESSAYILVKSQAVIGTTTLGGISGNPYNTPAQNAVGAIQELLQSQNFDVRVAKKTDLAKQLDLNMQANQDAVATLIQREVAVAPATVGQETFTITVDDKSAQLAQQLVQALIDQFNVDYTQRQIDNDKRAADLISQQITQVSSQVTQDFQRVQQYLQSHAGVSVATPDPQLASYEQQYEQDRVKLQNLKDQLGTLQFNQSAVESGVLNVFNVLDPPKLPGRPTLHLKKLLIYPGGALAIALALIGLIIGLQATLDKGIYTQQDVRSIVEDLDLDIASIESVPVLRGIGDRQRDEDEGSTYSGILVPVLTVLPQLSTDEMTSELRRAAGVGTSHSK